MKILVINSGSSSIRFQLLQINSKSHTLLFKCFLDAIGQKHSSVTIEHSGSKKTIKAAFKDHRTALETGLKQLIAPKIIKHFSEIEVVGHRVVHGGEKHKSITQINASIIKDIQSLNKLAPLHNPSNLLGILACRKLLPKASQYAVFDTAFHQSMPESAYLYGLPLALYQKHQIRRFGFHGTSHSFVSKEAISLLKAKKSAHKNLITCHLGNGCSITAIQNGKSQDTSMGFTPLEGVIMGTRCGDIDPALPIILQKLLKKSPEQIDHLMNFESGLLGISGISSDMRPIILAYQKNKSRARLAIELFTNRIAKKISAMTASLNGFDALIFTAGIGENAPLIRQKICDQLKVFGIKIDSKKNQSNQTFISAKESKIKVMIVPTNEELEIAKQCFNQSSK